MTTSDVAAALSIAAVVTAIAWCLSVLQPTRTV